MRANDIKKEIWGEKEEDYLLIYIRVLSGGQKLEVCSSTILWWVVEIIGSQEGMSLAAQI